MALGILKCSWEMLVENIEIFETYLIGILNLDGDRNWMKKLNLNYT